MASHLLATLADERYLDQAKQLFSSVYWNAGWKGDYMLLVHDVPEEKLVWFREKGILIRHCAPLSQEKIGTGCHPATVLSKLYLFTPEFKKWGNIVFLDSDIIVRASLDELASVRGFSAPNASGLDLKGEFYMADRVLWRRLRQAYQLEGQAFNTGVFAFSTDIIRDDAFDRLMGLLDAFGKLSMYGEEATLNLFFHKGWDMLPLLYNTYPSYMRSVYLLPASSVQAIILHFVSSVKPWDPKSPFHGEWAANYAKAGKIDLARPVPPAKIWTRIETDRYLSYLHGRRRPLFICMQFVFSPSAFIRTDRAIGRLGLFIRRISPALYKKVRSKRPE